jgi:predicted nucleic acid-binding protein
MNLRYLRAIGTPTPYRDAGPATGLDDVLLSVRRALLDVHIRSSTEPIRVPLEGAFPDDYLLNPPPVVVDANRLRDVLLYASKNHQRPVLLTAANAGLLRLFCAQHVLDEVVEHSTEWTEGSAVTRTQLLQQWTLGCLPLLRVVPDAGLKELLRPDEAARIQQLSLVDRDDVPSATLALVLGAFYLSNDKNALRAVYGPDADLSQHDEWLEVLKAGGNAGELSKMLQLAINMVVLFGGGIVSRLKRLAAESGPWAVGAGALLLVIGAMRTSHETRQRLRSAATSVGTTLLQTFVAYQQFHSQFQGLAPLVPGWDELSVTNDPDDVLARACLHTLARSAMSNRSAAELSRQLPFLPVAQGETKVRHTLRSHDYFSQVWRGRWQVGEVAGLLTTYLEWERGRESTA